MITSSALPSWKSATLSTTAGTTDTMPVSLLQSTKPELSSPMEFSRQVSLRLMSCIGYMCTIQGCLTGWYPVQFLDFFWNDISNQVLPKSDCCSLLTVSRTKTFQIQMIIIFRQNDRCRSSRPARIRGASPSQRNEGQGQRHGLCSLHRFG